MALAERDNLSYGTSLHHPHREGIIRNNIILICFLQKRRLARNNSLSILIKRMCVSMLDYVVPFVLAVLCQSSCVLFNDNLITGHDTLLFKREI